MAQPKFLVQSLSMPTRTKAVTRRIGSLLFARTVQGHCQLLSGKLTRSCTSFHSDCRWVLWSTWTSRLTGENERDQRMPSCQPRRGRGRGGRSVPPGIMMLKS
eukprot:3556220-Rhodomonas_salina.2